MSWRAFLSLFIILWIQDPVACEKDINTCTFYYWRVDWKTAVQTCERENKRLLCYKSKKEIDDITEAFRLSAFGTAELELWLSSENCNSTEMTVNLSLHIRKSNDTIWHFIQNETTDNYPFVCCINGTGEQTVLTEQHTTTTTATIITSSRTSDIFDTSRPEVTTAHKSSTAMPSFCKKIKRRGILWPDTVAGKTAVQPCPGNSTGEAKWFCEQINGGQWKESGPDLRKCRSMEVQNLKEKFNRTSATDIISELEYIFKRPHGDVFGEDLADIISLMSALPNRLFRELENLTDASTLWSSTSKHAEKTFAVINSIVQMDITWHDIESEQKSKTGSELLSTVEGMGSLVAYGMPIGTKYSFSAKNIAIETRKTKHGESVILPEWLESSSHRGSILLKQGYDSELEMENGDICLIYALYTNMTSILSPSVTGQNRSTPLNSAVLSTTVSQIMTTRRINKPVKIILEHFSLNPNDTACVFWNMSLNKWDTSGCRLEESNMTHSVCICDHLTNFALLMDYGDILSDVDQLPFHYITLIGCSLSIVCLAFCVFVFSCYSYHSRHSWSLRYVIHRNLCLTLLIANLVLIIGLDRTENQNICAITAGLLHYFFLSAFCWMFLEGVHIYLLLVVVFASRRSHWERYYLFGYGFPLLIVIITAISRPKYYGTKEICWLSVEKGTIWGFLGPIAAILILNIAALILAQYKASKISAKDDKVALLKRWLRVTFILFPILGITWIFGFLYLGKYFEIAGYLFAIFNSFQGVCIFVFHCLMDKKARSLLIDSFKKKNTSINTGSSGTHKRVKDQPNNDIKKNSITPIENDSSNKIVLNTFQLSNPKKTWWARCKKPWSFCFEMTVSDKDSYQKEQEEPPQAVMVQWNNLRSKNSS